MIKVVSGFERKNAERFKAHLNELSQDKSQRKSVMEKEISHVSRDAARFAHHRARGRVIVKL